MVLIPVNKWLSGQDGSIKIVFTFYFLYSIKSSFWIFGGGEGEEIGHWTTIFLPINMFTLFSFNLDSDSGISSEDFL